MSVEDKTQRELEAAAFRRLVEHLRARNDQCVEPVPCPGSISVRWPLGNQANSG